MKYPQKVTGLSRAQASLLLALIERAEHRVYSRQGIVAPETLKNLIGALRVSSYGPMYVNEKAAAEMRDIEPYLPKSKQQPK